PPRSSGNSPRNQKGTLESRSIPPWRKCSRGTQNCLRSIFAPRSTRCLYPTPAVVRANSVPGLRAQRVNPACGERADCFGEGVPLSTGPEHQVGATRLILIQIHGDLLLRVTRLALMPDGQN